MKVKLTLSIEVEKIKKIKIYAKSKGITVSKFLEQQIDSVVPDSPKKKLNITNLKGAFGKVQEPFDWKEIKTQHLLKKYGL